MLFTRKAKSVIRWLQYTIMKLNSNCSWGGQEILNFHYETLLKVNTKKPSTSAFILLWHSFLIIKSIQKAFFSNAYQISYFSTWHNLGIVQSEENFRRKKMHWWFSKAGNCMINLATKMHLGENLKTKIFFFLSVCFSHSPQFGWLLPFLWSDVLLLPSPTLPTL